MSKTRGSSYTVTDERTAHVAFAGDLDVYRRDEIAAALPNPDGIDRLVIDLREASMIDSSIISVVMRYRRSFIDAGREAHDIVILVTPQLRRIFEITGLTKSLTIVSASPETTTKGEPLTEA